ncbi:hypothetical protein BJ912DRAFT_1041417 [Pholiota molesta]|nr:hypothetical protein BJ912DRAFT_1041417 [Pholiota molesta]
MANDFCDLPQELHIQILSNLDAVSLIRCATTCTSIYDTFKGSSLLAYTIQLHLDGLKDGGTSLSHTERIESLMRRRRAWLALETKGPLTVRTQPDCDVFELAGGAFATASGATDHFEIVWLPTASDATKRTIRRPLNRRPLDENLLEGQFTTDPTQDLIVFLEDDGTPPSMTDTRIVHIHIRAISTNTIHPLAQQSPLQFTVVPEYDDANTYTIAVLQIAYTVVAVHFHYAGGKARALVWDWTTSDLILDTFTSFDHCLRSFAYDFGLLDSTYFFIVTGDNSGAIQLYKLVRSHAAATQAVHLATLHLPPTSPGATIRGIVSHAGPIEANPLPHTPFTVHDDHRLHMFTVQYTHPMDQAHYVSVFLHQRVLLKYACHTRTAQEHAPLDIPWAEWGPPNTRMARTFPPHYGPHWRRCVYGQRAVLTDYTTELPHAVELFDFSLAAVLSAKGILDAPSPAAAEGHPGRLLSSSTIRAEEDVPLFLDDVKTHLPCVQSTLDLKEISIAYMLYADGIIGVNDDRESRPLAIRPNQKEYQEAVVDIT